MAGAAAGGAGAATGSGSAGGAGAAAAAPVSGGSAQNSGATTGNTSFVNPSDPNFQSNLASALFSQNNMISSESNDIGSVYANAISGLKTSQQETNAGLAAGLATNVVGAQRTGAAAGVAEQTARRGMGMNTAIISNLQETTNQNINQLNAQYQQAIATGDAQTASKIADLQVQALKQKLDSQNQVFSNMTTIASTINAAQQTQIQQEAQNLAQQQAVANIAVQFGIPMTPGMTLADVMTKAAPLASQKEQASLGLMYAQTQAAEMQAKQAAAGISELITPDNADAMALQALSDNANNNSAEFKNIQQLATSQGATSQKALATAMTKQTSIIYGGDGTSPTPDVNKMTTNFLQQIKGSIGNLTPGSSQAAAAYNHIVAQLQSQYTVAGQAYGQFATQAQVQAATQALSEAQSQFLGTSGQGVNTWEDQLSNVMSQMFGGSPTAPSYKTPFNVLQSGVGNPINVGATGIGSPLLGQ